MRMLVGRRQALPPRQWTGAAAAAATCFLRARGYEASQELAASALAASPRLAAVLVESAAEGGPASLLSLNALTYLALCPQAVPALLSAGLLPVLLGQLRAAASASLEQQLLVSGLGLLCTLVRVDGEARRRLAAMRGAAAALAGALGHEASVVCAPALQLLQELVLTRKVSRGPVGWGAGSGSGPSGPAASYIAP
ncbi:hypothetical protein GPECTOR_19g306 [Gonium pectorale]|uniref:Uncharacterized protein n=1 Tax=Gonium pectorale TaxID=33097 RepID=A0A150GJK0_GONPE|nr:hypothetical protein GPECTOR_19g306 [Gonium pectorale]|eukprot:KXZ49855.1 hypothetical protein GPECTOR_19g306 [Gonium pectorale]